MLTNFIGIMLASASMQQSCPKRSSEMSLRMFRAGTLFGATPIPVIDNSGGIAPFCDATGQFMPLLCTMNCTLAPEEVAKPFQDPS